MRNWHLVLILLLVAAVVAGCGGDDSPSADNTAAVDEQSASAQDLESSADNAGDTGDAGYNSETLDTAYEGALPASSQLALGTFELEETENVVTPEQAKTLLPLWQAIQSGSLQSDAEANAVLNQIEGAMTVEQLSAIAAMQLTSQDMGAWMQEQGMSFGPPQGSGEGQSPFGEMSQEDRAARRATAQAGGGLGRGGGPFGEMSEEDRAAMRATAEASGMTFPGGSAAGGGGRMGRGQLALLAEPVVELLTERVGD
jgi:hypothetical protein